MFFNCIDGNGGTITVPENYTPPVLTGPIDYDDPPPEPVKKKRGRPRKSEKQENVIASRVDSNKPVPVTTPNTIMTNQNAIIDRYGETNGMLRHAIQQMDMLASEMKQELDYVRTAKGASITTKVKYDAISGIGGTIGQLIRGKIDAIKEINKSITDSNNMEIKRFKEIGDRDKDKNSDEKIMELYNAYINMPVGTYQQQGPRFPNPVDATTGYPYSVPMYPPNPPGGYLPPPQQQMTPEMNRMLGENNPNISTVVVSDPSNGTYQFDVIDRSTGRSIQNYPRPSQMILEGLTINPNTNTAINKDLNLEYDVIQRPGFTDYTQDPNTAQVVEDMGVVVEEPKPKVPRPISKVIKDNF